MKTFPLTGFSLPIMALTVLCHYPSNLSAAAPSYSQQEEPNVGSKVGSFFKGLFYGRSSSGRYLGEKDNPNIVSRGNGLDRPPQESTPSPTVSPIDTVPTNPSPPHEIKSLPREAIHPSAIDTPAIKTAPRKLETPPVNIKPKIEESLPPEPKKISPPVQTTQVAKIEPTTPTNPSPTIFSTPKPATEPKVEAPASTSGGLPVGSRTDKPGRVKSPYPPYNELDVSGLQSGSLAMDPTTQKVFRLP